MRNLRYWKEIIAVFVLYIQHFYFNINVGMIVPFWIKTHSASIKILRHPNDGRFHKHTFQVFLEKLSLTLPSNFSWIKAVWFLIATYNFSRLLGFSFCSFAFRWYKRKKSHMDRSGERVDHSRSPNRDISLAHGTTLELQPKNLVPIVNTITKSFREELVRRKNKNESLTAQARRGYCSSGPSFFGYSSSVDPWANPEWPCVISSCWEPKGKCVQRKATYSGRVEGCNKTPNWF